MRDPSVAKAKTVSKKSGNIFIGIGGWTFEPWRGVFYPEKLTQAKELSYAASKLTSIEINGTYYGSQKPESFRKWASEVPDGFVFSVKGPRFATNRRVLAEAGDSVKRFYDSGVLELGDRLGPVLWQFAPTKKFDGADFGKFLELLPRKLDGRALRHVVEVRHDSFCVPEFIALIRQFETPVVFAEHGKYPAIADVASDFVYARLQKGNDELKTCYPPKQLDAWAKRFQAWASGSEPDDLPRVDDTKPKKAPRDVFAYVIHEGKVRAPAGAMELIERVKKFGVQSSLMPASRISLVQLPYSEATKASSLSSGTSHTSPPLFSKRSLSSGSEARISRRSFAITSGGVLAGANIPSQESTSRPGTPASDIVGTSGASGLRFDDSTAMPFACPDCT